MNVSDMKQALADALDEIDDLSNGERLERTENIRRRFGIKTAAEINACFERRIGEQT